MKVWFLTGVLLNLLLGLSTNAQENFTGSTVRIYSAVRGTSTTKLGTGFVTLLNGKHYIITCYHVISGSSKITVFSAAHDWLENVKIVGYDDVKDIAILETKDLFKINPIPLNSVLPNFRSDAFIIGNSGAFNEQIIPVRFSSPKGFESSKSLRDASSNPIMKTSYDFPIIPLFTTAYGGMSGSPIISNGKAIGIFQGSVQTGGAYSWAVPSSSISKIQLKSALKNGLELVPLKSLIPTQKFLVYSLNKSSESEFELTPVNQLYNDIINISNHIKGINKSIDLRVSRVDSLYRQKRKNNFLNEFLSLIDSIMDSRNLLEEFERRSSIFNSTCNLVVSEYNQNVKVPDSSILKTSAKTKAAVKQLQLSSFNYNDLKEVERRHPCHNMIEMYQRHFQDLYVSRLNNASFVNDYSQNRFSEYYKILVRYHEAQSIWLDMFIEKETVRKRLVTQAYERLFYL